MGGTKALLGLISILSTEFLGINKMFPESGRGTSYGFDGTRFEPIGIGRDGATALRIVGGQESTLQVMAMANYIEYQMNNPKRLKMISLSVRQEIGQIQLDLHKTYIRHCRCKRL